MDSIYLVPTRGRPQNALRLLKAWADVTSPSTRLVFILDDDDPELDNYTSMFLDARQDECAFGYNVGPRLRLGGTLNYWGPKYAATYDWVGFMGDDHLPITYGWDRLLIEGAPRNAVVYGNDTIQGRNLPTAVLLDSRIVRALGYMVPPGLVHMYLDNFWLDLGIKLDSIVYRDDVVIQHVHPLAGHAEWDAGYVEVNSHMGPDGETYRKFCDLDGIALAAGAVQAYREAY